MDVQRKLEILADAAKYDASCASSGTEKRDSSDGKGLGSTAPGMGICHSYAPDGRCISLLKVLLTNACNYDCLYCVNRTSSNVARARFTVDEVVKLTIDFYRCNYIEGLFLSSGIIRSADYTMEQVVSVARKLREEHHFRGYGQRHALARHRSETGLGARHRERFPLDVSTASREDLLRVPGFGTKAVDRIIVTRRLTSIRLADWRGCTSRRRRRCRSSCSAITGRRRICSMARG
jgi:predicted DNA-binding helix-hairpin-helix protein